MCLCPGHWTLAKKTPEPIEGEGCPLVPVSESLFPPPFPLFLLPLSLYSSPFHLSPCVCVLLMFPILRPLSLSLSLSLFLSLLCMRVQ